MTTTLFKKIYEVSNSDKIKDLKAQLSRLEEEKKHNLELDSKINYLLGKYKQGVATNIIYLPKNDYEKRTILFTRIGLRYKKEYCVSNKKMLKIKDFQKEFKNKKFMQQFKKCLKDEGKTILNNIIEEISNINEDKLIQDEIKTEIKTDTQPFIKKMIDCDKNFIPKIRCETDRHNSNIELLTGRWNSLTINNYDIDFSYSNRLDYHELAVAEEFANDIIGCIDIHIKNLKEYNKKIDDVNLNFKTTFAKYLLIKEI